MTSVPASSSNGLAPRWAALIAGCAYLLNPVAYAEFYAYPKLVVTHNIGLTIANINEHRAMFAVMILCYLVNFIVCDIVMAWALYSLLAPVHKAVSMLAAWFQLVFAAMGLVAVYNLICVQDLLHSREYGEVFGPTQLQAQVLLHLRSFHSDFDFALVLFGIHLILVGLLIAASRYIPTFLGIVLVVNGLGYIINTVGSYLRPEGDFSWTFVTLFGEIVFLAWLLIRGWRIPESTYAPNGHAATGV
jgi:Domain of unknown function (DUF4386)